MKMSISSPRIPAVRAVAMAAAAALALPACAAHVEPVAIKAALPAVPTAGTLTIGVDRPGIKISPVLYGLMTEEINHAYDGGLYAELIQNRAFNDNKTNPAHWSAVTSGTGAATIALDRTNPVNTTALTTSLRIDITAASQGNHAGVANDGYWGIPAQPKTTYRASFYAKSGGGFNGPLTVSIESADGTKVAASAQVAGITPGWKKYTISLNTGSIAPSKDNRFVISATSPGTVWISQVSLFPPTYKNRPNGNRVDLMEKMAAMNPSFLRMPGGNYLEGNTIAERFEWKNTLGSIDDRPGHQCPWGYWSSDGMGLLEFLEWCEDLKMEPILAVFAGYALRGEHIDAGPKLQPFVQNALDEIEYLTGGPNTTWGARRIRDGHPKPFPLTYVEVGNEDWFDRSGSYDGRFAQFYDAIKKTYPKLQVIATMPVKARKPDVIDEHYYRTAVEMARDSGHYDKYDRNGPKIFVGEWASTQGSPTPNMRAALGDAAWMTGMERNSDIVPIEAYAPLLVNVNKGAAQWGTNLIGYDNTTSFGSPSYYVQQMFGNNRGDVVLPVTVDVPNPAPAVNDHPKGKAGVGTWGTQAEYKDVEVTQGTKSLYKADFAAGAKDWKFGGGDWKVTDGALTQSSGSENCRATVGDTSWTDYTYRVKARKVAGREGFLIIFHYQDDGNYIWWNLGGWGNTRTAIERFSDGAGHEIGGSTPMKIETGRWYDIRIEVAGPKIRCFLDDKLVTEAVDQPAAQPDPIYATASRDLQSGDIIMKIVNFSSADKTLGLNLPGAKDVKSTAQAFTIAGEPDDVNTIDAPTRIAPKAITITGVSDRFTHTFPAHSVTVVRVNAAK